MKDIQGSCARVSRGSVWQQLLCSSLWEAAEALGPSLQPVQPFQQHWIHSQPWHCQWCLLKPGQGCWPLHLLKESFVTISSMRPSRKKAVNQQNSGDKCCWEGYSLSIPARDFLKGVLFLSSFLLPEKTDLGKDLTGCPAMLDKARREKGTAASCVCLGAEQGSREQIQVHSDLNQKQQLLQCSEMQEHHLGTR